MLENKQTTITYLYIFSTTMLLSFILFLTACNNPQNTQQLSTPTTIPPIVTKPANTATAVATQTENPIPEYSPAKNGWTRKHLSTVSITSVSQYTQEEIASILFAQYLNHFKTEDADSYYRLDEYEILTVEVPKNLAYKAQEEAVDFVATVSFSVKPTVYNLSFWRAHPSNSDGVWLRNAGAFIGIYEKNKMYIMKHLGGGRETKVDLLKRIIKAKSTVYYFLQLVQKQSTR